MSVETQPIKSAKPDVHQHPGNRNHDSAAGSLSSSVWDSMKTANLPKTSQSAGEFLMFSSPFLDSKTGTVNARLEPISPAQPSSVKGQEAVKTRKNPDGGHTDTSTGANGSTEVSTYDPSGKLVFKRTDNRDGTYSEWRVDANGHVSIREKGSDGSLRVRDEYPNGNFKEQTTYKDGKKSSISHFADNNGGYVDDKINRDGSETLSHFDQDGTLVFKYAKNSDGSFSQRKLNTADGSIVFHDEKADGSYTESKVDKSGTWKTTHTVNKRDGSSETKNYDPSGKLVKERQEKKNHSFKETTYDADGNKTVHEQDAKGDYAEQFFNSKGERISPTIAVVKASPEFVQQVKDEIARLPESVRKLLAKNDSVIAIAGKMSDVDPAQAKERPRGYEKGETGDDSGGSEQQLIGKNGKKLELAIIAEKTRSGLTDDIEGTVRHEVGHMIDHMLNDYSHSAVFKAAFDQDVAKMSKETKESEKYFLQKGNHGKDGREEAFAEVVRAVTGDPTEARNAEVLKQFPKLAELIKTRLGALN